MCTTPKALSQKMEFCNYSFDYGMFWGMATILCMLYILLLFKNIELLPRVTFNPDIQETKYVRYMCPFVLAFSMIFCAPVAIYLCFLYDLLCTCGHLLWCQVNLPTLSVYLLPAKLLCCCSEKRARALVLSLTLWFDLVTSISRQSQGPFCSRSFSV